jgi:hypothetical protein
MAAPYQPTTRSSWAMKLSTGTSSRLRFIVTWFA